MDRYDDSSVSGRRWPRRLGVGLLLLAFAALAGGVLYFSERSRDNLRSAERWQERAQRTDRLLTARTRQLNTRSRALNRAADDLAASQRDVKQLEQRQRSLADEKAQVEDERGQMVVQTSHLTTLVNEMSACSDGLEQLLGELASDDMDAVDAHLPAVSEACGTARADFAAFQQLYGGT